MAVKKRKVPEPLKSLSPVFSSREDELLIEESQKLVELAAKKRNHQQSTKSSATGIVPGYDHVYSLARNCGLSNLYNSGFYLALSMEFNHCLTPLPAALPTVTSFLTMCSALSFLASWIIMLITAFLLQWGILTIKIHTFWIITHCSSTRTLWKLHYSMPLQNMFLKNRCLIIWMR